MAKEVAPGHRVPDDEWAQIVADAEAFALDAEAQKSSEEE